MARAVCYIFMPSRGKKRGTQTILQPVSFKLVKAETVFPTTGFICLQIRNALTCVHSATEIIEAALNWFELVQFHIKIHQNLHMNVIGVLIQTSLF